MYFQPIAMYKVDFKGCHGLNCDPLDSYIEALTPDVTIFGDRAFMAVINVK